MIASWLTMAHGEHPNPVHHRKVSEALQAENLDVILS